MPELPKMYPVWVEAENGRVCGIDNDEQGALWFADGLPKLHRYWPKTGKIDEVPVPPSYGERFVGSQCLCAAGKVYTLSMTHPKITVYEVAKDRVSLLDKPFPEASLWWGHTDTARGLLYLPERSRPCLIVWDVEDEQGEAFSYPEAGALPSVLETEWPERLEVFSVPGEEPARRVYFDPEVRRFVAEDREEIPLLRPGTEGERYIVYYNDGRMMRLDRKTGDRHERAAPGWGETFAFIGGGVFYRGWQLNNLGTGYNKNYRYNRRTGEFTPLKEGDPVDPQKDDVRRALETVDGHPHHFMDRFLAYHPETDTFDFLIPDVPKDRYPQLCYNHVMNGELYITANDIFSKEKGRALGASEWPVGQVMVLQSHPVGD